MKQYKKLSFYVLLIAKISLSVLLVYFMHTKSHLYIDGFDLKESIKITGPLFGTCAPIEHLQEINKMIFPKLDKIVVSIILDTFKF